MSHFDVLMLYCPFARLSDDHPLRFMAVGRINGVGTLTDGSISNEGVMLMKVGPECG